MAPSSRIILTILSVTGMGLVLCAALIYGSLDRLSLRTTESNVDFLLTQLRDTVEANVSLGLPLSNIRAVQNLIERAKAADDRVLAVEVFSPVGVSLFNTDRGSIGEPISPAWHTAVRYRIVDGRWRVEELGDIVVGEVIRNDFGEPVGYLAMTISGATRGQQAEAVLGALAPRFATVLPLALLVVFLVAVVVLDMSSRQLGKLAEHLTAGAAMPAAVVGPGSLLADAQGVRLSVDRAVEDFDRATAEVLRVDET